MSPASRLFFLLFLFLVLLGSAVLLPQFADSGSDGFAAGATAAVTFLAFLFIAFVLAIAILVLTLRHRAGLAGGAKVAGFLPLPLVAVTVVLLIVLAGRKQRERQQEPPPPAAATPVPTAP
jgi:hypothetical protein